MNQKGKILIAEEPSSHSKLLETIFKKAGFHVLAVAGSMTAAQRSIAAAPPDVAVIDIDLKGQMSGLELGRALAKKGLPFIYYSAGFSAEILKEAKITGPAAFLMKPLREKDLLAAVELAIHTHRQIAAVKENKDAPAAASPTGETAMVGQGQAMQLLRKDIQRVSRSDIAVLILGESGTGKELLATHVHLSSSRSNRPLITVNCAALPPSLIESELFGHEKGAFTGAMEKRKGRFEMANGGTIFLDEIGELSLEVQAKFLRVLQEKEIEVVGGQVKKVDVRIIAATNKDLPEEIGAGRFRADLYYRLNGLPIISPPLRERKEDLPALVEHFIKKFSALEGKKALTIDDASLSEIQAYHWPGNIRELENTIHRAVLLCKGSRISGISFAAAAKKPLSSAQPASRKMIDVERDHITNVLRECDWKVYGANGAAEILGMKVATLNSRIKKLGIRKTGLKKNKKPYRY
ncbi:DNA-binding NtrC family response regulator [Mucilaginibacter rubeus]|uniref:sigma-54-dependent transcriptional regulator n=1 Tax=Mucilaginibacter rubeus TaxID=2027860 RepID=UPI0033975830